MAASTSKQYLRSESVECIASSSKLHTASKTHNRLCVRLQTSREKFLGCKGREIYEKMQSTKSRLENLTGFSQDKLFELRG